MTGQKTRKKQYVVASLALAKPSSASDENPKPYPLNGGYGLTLLELMGYWCRVQLAAEDPLTGVKTDLAMEFARRLTYAAYLKLAWQVVQPVNNACPYGRHGNLELENCRANLEL